MERKLVKQGRNALTMTLPSKWIKKHALNEDSFVNVKEDKENLIISSNSNKIKTKIKLDITNMQRGLAFHIVTGKYIEGFDEIEIKHNNFELSQQIGNGFLGMIIQEHTNEKLIMKNIISIPEDNFLSIFKRGAQLLITQIRALEKQTKKELEYKNIKFQERLLDNNLFYCLRYINKYEKIENSYKYFLLTTTLESVGDLISEISKVVNKNLHHEKDLKIINDLVCLIENYVVFLFQNDFEKTYKLLKDFKKETYYDTFIGGLAHAIGENLYNYIGYLIDKK